MIGFTAHNIRFADGSCSMPERTTLVADEPRCTATMRFLRSLYGDDLSGKSIIDLGCLEGGYTVEFARAGMNAVGLEVRQSNFSNCLEVKEKVGLPNLNFVRDDVWNIKDHGSFDIVFCCGLLYHLDRPREFLKLLGEVAKDAIIVNTHVAPMGAETRFNLAPLSVHEGMPGRWVEEHPEVDETVLDTLKWASWNNQQSFWMTREAHVQAISDAGFDLVMEQWDAAADPADLLAVTSSDDYRTFSRTVFLGINSKRNR